MHETHTKVTSDGSKHPPGGESEQPVAGALTVRTERRADVMVLWLSGALDKATSALLDREFDAQAGHVKHVVVDLTGLTLIDSRGLATLLRAHRRAGEHDQRTSFRQGPMRDGSRSSSPPDAKCVPSRRLAHQSGNKNFFRAREGVR